MSSSLSSTITATATTATTTATTILPAVTSSTGGSLSLAGAPITDIRYYKYMNAPPISAIPPHVYEDEDPVLALAASSTRIPSPKPRKACGSKAGGKGRGKGKGKASCYATSGSRKRCVEPEPVVRKIVSTFVDGKGKMHVASKLYECESWEEDEDSDDERPQEEEIKTPSTTLQVTPELIATLEDFRKRWIDEPHSKHSVATTLVLAPGPQQGRQAFRI